MSDLTFDFQISKADHGVSLREVLRIWLRARAFLIAASVIMPAFAASPQAEGFKQLTGPQIQRAFSGKQFSDDVHFSYRYAPGGTIQGTRMGKKVADKWAVAKDRLCVTDSFGENCYAVWMKGSAVKLTIDKSDFSLEGFLK